MARRKKKAKVNLKLEMVNRFFVAISVQFEWTFTCRVYNESMLLQGLVQYGYWFW